MAMMPLSSRLGKLPLLPVLDILEAFVGGSVVVGVSQLPTLFQRSERCTPAGDVYVWLSIH